LVVVSQASVVQALPSAHDAPAAAQQPEMVAWRQRCVFKLHESNVHAFPSEHCASLAQHAAFD
jgi:hypothetical protein